VQQQNDFFEKGIAYLKPLTLRHIAEKIEVHESTVGRVTQGKYMATPRGVFELKFFFTSAVHDSDGGDEVSSTSVKHLIKELIDQEKATGVLSDDKLVDLLQDKGIAVARRTVAKYREAMHIPSSVQRRRQKKINAGA
jgi:RNA polymerase sigma-54 factor